VLESDPSGSVAEGERHPKGKRKRTALVPFLHVPYVTATQLTSFTDRFPNRAKDKAILEAAYSANPKPDKAARLDIVKRVSLNEKEVQVSSRLCEAGVPVVLTRVSIHGSMALTACSDLVPKPSAE
jgi:hypothetical protein